MPRNRMGRQDSSKGSPPALLRAVWDPRELSGTPEWRMLCALGRLGDKPDRIRPGVRGRQAARHFADAGLVRADIRYRLTRGGDRQGDPHVSEPV